ncbi:MAG: L-histidine N(alpha)-methyltransferase [Marinilabiliaceae bacterium]|nr:L-histidine N(alpha)-methyltransferase [Marinilabiliaceae bacterium]
MPHSTTSLSLPQKITIKNQLKAIEETTLKSELRAGLLAQDKYISSKFFYDRAGSALFEMITELPEYYPTRTEKSILQNGAQSFFSKMRNLELIELGSGDSSKISMVLNAVPPLFLDSITYRPIDFSASAIQKSARDLSKRFPTLTIDGLVADFTSKLHLEHNGHSRVLCFFGSTLGNFTPHQATTLLSNISSTMHQGDQLFLGIDMEKPIPILEAAYNDSQRITEAFNKNILRVTNNLLKTNFIPIHFEHLAYYNEAEHRIEMHLKARKKLTIESPYLDANIILNKGESIHTENSYKFSEERIKQITTDSNLQIKEIFYDIHKWFGLVQLEK